MAEQARTYDDLRPVDGANDAVDGLDGVGEETLPGEVASLDRVDMYGDDFDGMTGEPALDGEIGGIHGEVAGTITGPDLPPAFGSDLLANAAMLSQLRAAGDQSHRFPDTML